MKFKKKTTMLVSFTVGTLLLATTALADIASKSGYDEFKDALKVTAEQSSEKFDSFTMDFSMAMKDNGKTLISANETTKFDRTKGASESLSANVDLSGYNNTSQTYSDKTTVIRVSESDPTYYVTEYTKEREDTTFKNPFKEDSADDLEKIADAIIGSLKDHVIVTENSDGSKGLAGKLTEVQIPSLVNAVASFQLKQEFNGHQNKVPHLTKDVFVKEVNGTAKVNQDGVMESILGTVVLSGKDDQGTEHNITIEALAKVTDINSTTVTKPDLTGKVVVRNIAKDYSESEITNPEKFVGKFKNDILIEKNGKFAKIGERFVDITHMDNKSVVGRYYEEYKPGFEEYSTNNRNINFSAQFEKDQRGNGNFEYTTESGGKGQGNIYISDYQGKVNFNLHNMNTSPGGLMFDSTFSPDLD
ncbi:hypothetical protein [Desulfosporosinus sp. BICA1-9]|uniref:hypothetical protein n=1 Tax=Desulfosporosinus sp. BICA1-9 TaxID=1531958 RepID=UPI00054B0306|nr:hypothetical protein [Desulfosporosinus sp. BICA1-9]KJS46271.1 MAG: hypothetical protein VR66_26425 [Peptococcaceae bacterium BRH_c23]KJS80752.1 MAG: hypothetical protein JL57_27535 [Desulfosporosinus sp. BICA1-9]HBW35869.1 hypothetical protein [Desulfosporosinus sp.]